MHVVSNIGLPYKWTRQNFIPGTQDKSSHSCAHGRKWQYQPCTSAIVSEGSPVPLVPQTILLLHSRCKKNIPEPDAQGRWAMAVFAYLLMLSSAQWTCIVLFPLSSHALCQLCRSETCRIQWSTWQTNSIFRKLFPATSKLKVMVSLVHQDNLCQSK